MILSPLAISPMSQRAAYSRSTPSPLLTDISAYFKLDEASGAVIDSVNANNGTNVGATPNVSGKINTAYSFDGVNDYINIDDVLPVVASDTAGTWSAWVKPTDGTPTVALTIYSFSDTTGQERFAVIILSTGNVLLLMLNSSNVIQFRVITDAAVVATDTWTHIVMVQPGDDTTPLIYIDSVLVAQSTTVTTDLGFWLSDMSNVDNVRIGCRLYNSIPADLFFDGEIDEVDIHSRALSAAEISEIYNNYIGLGYPFDGATANPINEGISAYFKLDESSGSVLDAVNQNNGTNVGATANVAGKINTAYSFDGVNDYINIDNVLPVVANDTQGTWSAWVKPVDSTPTVTEIFVSISNTNANEYINLTITNIGILQAASRISGTLQFALSTDNKVFTDSTWTHIALVQDGVSSSPILYVNGVAVDQTLTASDFPNTWTSLLTGADNMRLGDWSRDSVGETSFFDGEIDEVDIHSRALSASEITEIYNNYIGLGYPFDGATANPINEGISAYFKLDESTGSVLDSVNQNNGTNVGATANVAGKINTAYSFDGVNDYINIDDVLPVVANDTQGTWSCWAKPTDATPIAEGMFISFGDKSAIEFLHLSILTTGVLRMNCIVAGVGQWRLETDTAVFSDGVWTHIAVVQNATIPVFYIDGAEYSASEGNATFAVSADKTAWLNDFSNLDASRIGDRNVNNAGEISFFYGEIDEVDIHSRALSVAEITEIYNSGDGKQHPF